MRQTRESARACPKGRRKLEFDAQKQQLPLLNKAVYMDMKHCKQADLMEEQLKKLGARVEKFLSCEVNYVISSSGPSKADEKPNSKEENPHSPSNISSPFNCGPSPSGQPECRTSVVSRGKALAQIACAKNMASTVVANAEKLGIKVVSTEVASKWLDKEVKKLKCFKEKHIKENKGKKAERKQKENTTKSKLLRGSFIKFEDKSRHYRPVKLELEKWPKLNLSVPPGICPFGESKVKVQHHYVARNLHPHINVVDRGSVPVKRDETVSQLVDEAVRPAQKPAVAEFVGVPIATAGDAKHILNCHLRKSVAINKQQGYCDCCGVKFQNMDEHINGEEHRNFARQKSNYERLDALINQVPSTVSFLQSVLLKHCVQKQGETSVSSCPADNLLMVDPVSPLTTEKTHLPSPEIAVACLKTPEPSEREISMLKEKMTVTDTDLISRQERTPTKKENMSDNRPQAVVIRRPLPSGMFTSPRRRQLTPSKKPWMQECSMVFRDSPIASLQLSGSNGQSFTRFLSDSTLDTKYKKVKMSGNCLTRLDVVKPPFISDEIIGTMLSKNFSNLNNDFMLSEIMGWTGTDKNQPTGSLKCPVDQQCTARRSFNALQTFGNLNQEHVHCVNEVKDSQQELNMAVGQVVQEVDVKRPLSVPEEMIPQMISPIKSKRLAERDPNLRTDDVSYQIASVVSLRDDNENVLLDKEKCSLLESCSLLNPVDTHYQSLNQDGVNSPQKIMDFKELSYKRKTSEVLPSNLDNVSVACTAGRVVISHDELEEGIGCKKTQFGETSSVVNINKVSCTFTTNTPLQNDSERSPLIEEGTSLLFRKSRMGDSCGPHETSQSIDKFDKGIKADIKNGTLDDSNMEFRPHLNCEEAEEKGRHQEKLTTTAVSKSLSKKQCMKQASDLPGTITGLVENECQEISYISNADYSVVRSKKDTINSADCSVVRSKNDTINIADCSVVMSKRDTINIADCSVVMSKRDTINNADCSIVTDKKDTINIADCSVVASKKDTINIADCSVVMSKRDTINSADCSVVRSKNYTINIVDCSVVMSKSDTIKIADCSIVTDKKDIINIADCSVVADKEDAINSADCSIVRSKENSVLHENSEGEVVCNKHKNEDDKLNVNEIVFENDPLPLFTVPTWTEAELEMADVHSSESQSTHVQMLSTMILKTSPINNNYDNPSCILNHGQHEDDSSHDLTLLYDLDMDLAGLNPQIIKERNVSEENCIAEEAAKDSFSVNKHIQKQTVETFPAVNEESTNHSGVFISEDNVHQMVGSVHENENINSLTSSETMNSLNSRNEICKLLTLDYSYSNSGENSERVITNQEDSEMLELVVVPNIADRVKRRNRVACLSLQSAIDKDGNAEKKRRRKRRRRGVKLKNKDKLSLPGIERLQPHKQLNDNTRQIADRNVAYHTQTQQVGPSNRKIVPNIAESVKRRRSCTHFNHEGQYANSGEGSDGENILVKTETQSAQKYYKCDSYSMQENKAETFEYKNGVTKQLSVVLSRDDSMEIKPVEGIDMNRRKMEAYWKLSNKSECRGKTEDEMADLSSAVVIRRKKSSTYQTFPSQKRPEVDWGNLEIHKDWSSDQDKNDNNVKTLLNRGKNIQMDQSHSLSSHGQCQRITHCMAQQNVVVREAKVTLVDINSTAASPHHSDDDTLVIHRPRYKKRKQTMSQTSSSNDSQNTKTFSPISSSAGISCSPRLRLKIRRQPDNKGFSSTLEEIHYNPADEAFARDVTENVDKEKCTEKYSKNCPISLECKSPKNIYVNSPDRLHSLPHSHCTDLMQSSSHTITSSNLNRCQKDKIYHSNSLESPVRLQKWTKIATLTLKNITPSHANKNVSNMYTEQDQEELTEKVHSTISNTLQVQEMIQTHSLNCRPQSPCFSSPISNRHIKPVATPKKYSAPGHSVSECKSPVFKMCKKKIKYRQESPDKSSAFQYSKNFLSQEDSNLSLLDHINMCLERNEEVGRATKPKTAANNHTAGESHHLKRMCFQSSLDFPSAKRVKIDRHVASAHESKQDLTLFEKHRQAPDYAMFSGRNSSAPSQTKLKNTELIINAEETQIVNSAAGPVDKLEAVDLLSKDSTECEESSIQVNDSTECEESSIHVPTFSSPDKFSDSSWGDICDSYLSTSISKHKYQPSRMAMIGKSPISKEVKDCAGSPFRTQFNLNSPTRKRTPKKETQRAQNTPNREDGCKEHKTPLTGKMVAKRPGVKLLV